MIYINNKKLAKLTPLKCSNSSESNLYIKDDQVYKIYKDNIAKQRKCRIQKLMDMDIDNCVLPNDLIYERKNIFSSSDFIGYSMDYLKDYKTLDEVELDFNTRLLICHKIYEIFKHMKDKGLIYFDVHGLNIMYNNDIKFVDVDSAYDTNEYILLASACQNLNFFIVNFLAQVDLSYFNNRFISYETLYETLGSMLGINREMIEVLYSNTEYYLDDCIDKITEEKVNRLKLNKKM